MSPSNITCAYCHKAFGAHFAIVRFDQQNKETTTILVCSLLCMCQWAYAACINQGIKVVFGVQSAVARIKSALFGG